MPERLHTVRALMVSARKAYRGSEKASRPVLIGRGRAPLVGLTGSLRGRPARRRRAGESTRLGTDALQFNLNWIERSLSVLATGDARFAQVPGAPSPCRPPRAHCAAGGRALTSAPARSACVSASFTFARFSQTPLRAEHRYLGRRLTCARCRAGSKILVMLCADVSP